MTAEIWCLLMIFITTTVHTIWLVDLSGDVRALRRKLKEQK